VLLLVAFMQPPANEPQVLLDKAIAAAGGANALAAATTIEWTARGTAYTSGSAEAIEGRWLLQPPDAAEVTTWAPGQPAGSGQRIVISGANGWTERNGVRTPLPAAAVAHERDQLYVFSLMRLLPLRDPEMELSMVSPRTLLVRHPRRPDVEAVFGDDDRLTALRTTISHPEDNSDIVHEVRVGGIISGGGITWPRTIRVTHDGKPALDLEVTSLTLRTLSKPTGEREKGRKR
jgi:hypothetical protein